MARSLINQFAAGEVMLRGAPGFFVPRSPPPVLRPPGSPGATSWYDTAELRRTLERLVDFDRINRGTQRFSVGAVNVRTGNFTYFDNRTTRIRPEHVMASGALPPAFEAVEIDGEPYWDGGLVSNTPLDWVLNARTELDTLVFQVDLWSARGETPKDLSEVAVRLKEIQFSSRTRAATDSFRRMQTLRAAFNDLLAKMPPDLANTPEAQLLARASDPAVYNIVQLIYQSATYEGQSKDYEFSRTTMDEHWLAGRHDAERTLAHPEVLQRPDGAFAVQTFDFTSAAGHGRSSEPNIISDTGKDPS
jgi:NTE family protein